MSHSHSHSDGEAASTYFLDQLCTIAVCGLLGFTAIQVFRTDMLDRIDLIPQFRPPVLIGGIVLLALVALRSIAVWRLAGETGPKNQGESPAAGHSHGHEHSHSHGHEHSHSHDHVGHEHSHSHGHEHSHAQPHGEKCEHESHARGHEGHEHGHAHGGGEHDDHDHGWAPWTYVVLLLPVVLFFLGMPKKVIDTSRLNDERFNSVDTKLQERRNVLAQLAGSTVLLYKKGGKTYNLYFTTLQEISNQRRAREFYEGQMVALTGQYYQFPGRDNAFKLFRMKVTCCGADAVPLQAIIVTPSPLQGFNTGDWVRIEGELSFQKHPQRDEWLPVIELPSMEHLQRTREPENRFDKV